MTLWSESAWQTLMTKPIKQANYSNAFSVLSSKWPATALSVSSMLISGRIKGCASGRAAKIAGIHRIESVQTIGKYVQRSGRDTFAPQTLPPRLTERGEDDAAMPSRRMHGRVKQVGGTEIHAVPGHSRQVGLRRQLNHRLITTSRTTLPLGPKGF